MVGQPKSLTDLRKIDADVKATCRACGHARVLDREQLIGALLRRRRNLAWDTLPHQLACSRASCRSKDVQVVALLFASEPERQAPAEFDRFIERINELVSAITSRPNDVPGLQALSAARLAYEEARRALAAWCQHRNV